MEKIRQNSIPLGEYVKGKIYRGVLTGLNEAFVIDQSTRDRLIAEDPKSAELIKPFLQGRDIKRFAPTTVSKYLIFTRRGVRINDYQAIKSYLLQFREKLIPRPRDWKGENWRGRKPGSYKWYEIQDSIDYHEEFEKTKIIFPDISIRGNFTLDTERKYIGNTGYIIPTDDLFLLGILNSKLFDFYYRQISSTYRGGYLRYIYQYLTELPIRMIDSSKPTDVKIKERIISLSKHLLELNTRICITPLEETSMKNLIRVAESKLDEEVYKLYQLDEYEVDLIESKL